MSDKFDVYIAYSHKDLRIVSHIVEDLKQSGFKVWWDQEAIILGHRLREAINRGIASSTVLLLFVSSRSLVSEWVKIETASGLGREVDEKRTVVIPILIGRLRDSDLPPDIKSKQYLDLRHGALQKYKQKRHLLLYAIRSSSTGVHPFDAADIMAIPVGDELLRFFSNHRFSQRQGATPFRKNGYEAFCRSVVEVWKEDDEQGGLDGTVKQFVDEYGMHAAVLVVAYFVGEMDIDPFKSFTVEEIFLQIHSQVRAVAAVFGLSRRLRWKYDHLSLDAGIHNGDLLGFRLNNGPMKGPWAPLTSVVEQIYEILLNSYNNERDTNDDDGEE